MSSCMWKALIGMVVVLPPLFVSRVCQKDTFGSASEGVSFEIPMYVPFKV